MSKEYFLMFTRTITSKIMLLAVFGIGFCFADNETANDANQEKQQEMTREELFSPNMVQKLSLTYGHFISKSLDNPTFKMDAQEVIKGIQEGQEGKSAPMTEKEYEQTLQQIQKIAFEDMANKNLQEAESFLQKNAKEEGVQLLESGKVQYKIMQEGSGDSVTEETVPTINYSVTYSNGTKLGSTEQQGGPIEVPLNGTIPGFKKGLMGMKVGEKRRIFVHPEQGYGTSGPIPNGLMVFEVEVTKVSEKPKAPIADNDSDGDDDDDNNDNDDDNDDNDDDDEEDEGNDTDDSDDDDDDEDDSN